MKLLVEIIGKTFSDINYTHVFLGQSPKASIKNSKTKILTKKEIQNPDLRKDHGECIIQLDHFTVRNLRPG